jgi:hypothetical protein
MPFFIPQTKTTWTIDNKLCIVDNVHQVLRCAKHSLNRLAGVGPHRDEMSTYVKFTCKGDGARYRLRKTSLSYGNVPYSDTRQTQIAGSDRHEILCINYFSAIIGRAENG